MRTDLGKLGGLLMLFFCLSARTQTISILDIPDKLPSGLTDTNYSPPIAISYSGLQAGQIYTLSGWLLIPGSWDYGSSFWRSNSFSPNPPPIPPPNPPARSAGLRHKTLRHPRNPKRNKHLSPHTKSPRLFDFASQRRQPQPLPSPHAQSLQSPPRRNHSSHSGIMDP